MGKVVVLKFDGNLDTEGFKVTLEVRSERQTLLEKQGYLPPNQALAQHLQLHWGERYRSLGADYRIKPRSIIRQDSLQKRIQACRLSAKQLQEQIKAWLETDTFRTVDQRLREELSREEEIQVLLRTEDINLKKLPLHLWDFFERYPGAELALSPVEIEPVNPVINSSSSNRVRILVILGYREGIDTEKDLEIIQTLPQAESVLLTEPTHQEINHCLWEESWDIIFFAGHSETELEGIGRIYINPQDSLTVSELWFGLRKAVEKGLKLAIFNSCDGLGLARKLNDLNIPQMIVMRELVPDQVAQQFLKHFLTNFAAGKSFYLAVREARERLHDDIEQQFPCASWLPVICQNPGYTPPTWDELAQKGLEGSIPQQSSRSLKTLIPPRTKQREISAKKWHHLPKALLSATLVTGLMMGVRSLGWLQPWELKTYDHFMQLRPDPDHGQDDRLLLIGITETDVQAQSAEERQGRSLSNQSLTLLINKLQQHNPRVIGLHLYRETPIPTEDADLMNQMQSDRFFGICRYGDANQPGVAAPPEISSEQQGFSNFVDDPDGIIRRNLLSIGLATDCQTRYSFAWKLAERYLKDEGISTEITPEGLLSLSSTTFHRLEQESLMYEPVTDFQGHQIMLNYRTSGKIAAQVSLSDILQDRFEPEDIRDRIVIIGTVAPSFNDHHWLTPYSYRYQEVQKMTGIEIQAQMVSQILSSVLDSQPLIWWLPNWGEGIWIFMWSTIGSLLVLNIQSSRYSILTIGVTLIVVYGSCFLILIQGGWIPFVPAALALIVIVSFSALKLPPFQQS